MAAKLAPPDMETGRNRGSLRGRRLSIGGRVGEPGEPPMEVVGEFVVEHLGADLE